jgi:hypothetical protein
VIIVKIDDELSFAWRSNRKGVLSTCCDCEFLMKSPEIFNKQSTDGECETILQRIISWFPSAKQTKTAGVIVFYLTILEPESTIIFAIRMILLNRAPVTRLL